MIFHASIEAGPQNWQLKDRTIKFEHNLLWYLKLLLLSRLTFNNYLLILCVIQYWKKSSLPRQSFIKDPPSAEFTVSCKQHYSIWENMKFITGKNNSSFKRLRLKNNPDDFYSFITGHSTAGAAHSCHLLSGVVKLFATWGRVRFAHPAAPGTRHGATQPSTQSGRRGFGSTGGPSRHRPAR